MNDLVFYSPQAITFSDELSFPVFHFTEELRKLAPEVEWTIIGKPMAMLDCHVAQCYGKSSNSFNVQMERNRDYFKDEWRFQPTLEEWKILKHIAIQQLTDVVTKCHDIGQHIDNQILKENFTSSPLVKVFGSAAKSPSIPWFYSKKGINMAAFFQSTSIARTRAMYIIEVFDEFERAAFDPTTDIRVRAYLQKVLDEKLPKSPIDIILELGFQCSLPNNIAIKQDIVKFLKIPEDTLSSFLYKHRDEIKPIVLKTNEIRSINSKASRMNGYSLDDVAKIVLGMDTETGIEVKKILFGHLGTFVKTKVKGEIEWRQTLGRVFDGLDLKYNHPIGNYRVDFFIPDFFGFGLCLECNGYCHKFYDPEEDKKREEYIRERYALVRFHHKISLEDLVNGILKAKPKEVITLYNIEQLV